MAIYKCAPAAVANSSARLDARLLAASTTNLDEQALFLFSGAPETSSVIVNTEEAGLSVYDWYSRQSEEQLGKKTAPYLYIPFEAEKIAAPAGGSVIINNQDNEAVLYTLQSPEDGSLYFNKTEALAKKGNEGDLSDPAWKNDFLAWKSAPGSVFSFDPGLTLVLEEPAFVLMFSALVKGNGQQPMIADASRLIYVRDGEATPSMIGYTSVFELDRCVLDGSISMRTDDESFEVVLCIAGDATISQGDQIIHAEPGTSVLIPANQENVVVTGNATFIFIRLI